jgi:hypothetical protein
MHVGGPKGMTNKQKPDKLSPAEKQANKPVEDPLQSIAQMRQQEQEDIMKDLKKMQDMRTASLERINAIRKRGRK